MQEVRRGARQNRDIPGKSTLEPAAEVRISNRNHTLQRPAALKRSIKLYRRCVPLCQELGGRSSTRQAGGENTSSTKASMSYKSLTWNSFFVCHRVSSPFSCLQRTELSAQAHTKEYIRKRRRKNALDQLAPVTSNQTAKTEPAASQPPGRK